MLQSQKEAKKFTKDKKRLYLTKTNPQEYLITDEQFNITKTTEGGLLGGIKKLKNT